MNNISVHKDPEVAALIDLYQGLLTPASHLLPIKDHLTQLSERLVYGHLTKHEGFKFPTSVFFGKKSTGEIFSSQFTLNDARLCVAKEFQYHNWEEIEALHPLKPDKQFETAVNYLLSGNIKALTSAIKENPNIVHQTSCYPHKATLLHYAGSNGIEGYRQVVPQNLPALLEELLASGADSALEANIYGGCTAQELMRTSKHPHEAGLYNDLEQVFLRFKQ